MVKATVVHQDQYRWPEDVMFNGRLVSVEERKQDFTYKEHHQAVKNGKAKVGELGQVVTWQWWFKFEGGADDGEKIRIETRPGITNREDDRGRQIAETLLARQLQLDEEFDSDSIVGLPCRFTIRHQEPVEKRDGTMGYYCEIGDVFPPAGQYDEPPF
jgi:hypothetical protein